MRSKEFLQLITEKMVGPGQAVPGDSKLDPLYGLKLAIASKIKDLPDTPEVKDQLEDIEDALKHLDVGKKRRASAEDELANWSDQDVQAAKSLLARYIVSMNAPFESKVQMMTMWRDGGLIRLNALLGPGVNTMDKIVKGYSKNPAIKEMANDLLRVDSMGKGKGEFFLKVLSPGITAPAGNKGDVEVKGKGKLEVKTYDQNGGRLGDQEVVPGDRYLSLVKRFFDKFSQYYGGTAGQEEPGTNIPTQKKRTVKPATQNAPVTATRPVGNSQPASAQGTLEGLNKAQKKAIPDSGLNIKALNYLYNQLPDSRLKSDFVKSLSQIVAQAFPQTSPAYGNAIASAISKGDIGTAQQLYGTASFLNYMAIKQDIGILFINISVDPATFVFINDLASLSQSKLRFQISTAYPVSKVIRNVHPPILVVPTTRLQPSI